MIFTLPDLLTADAVSSLVTKLEAADIVAGKTTAGWHAKTVKNNQQLANKSAELGFQARRGAAAVLAALFAG